MYDADPHIAFMQRIALALSPGNVAEVLPDEDTLVEAVSRMRTTMRRVRRLLDEV